MTDDHQNNWEMKCPDCGCDDFLQVRVPLWVHLYKDGSEVIQQDHEWDSDSQCLCENCDYQNRVGLFEEAYQQNAAPGKRVRELLEACAALVAAVDGTTDQFN